MTLTTEPISADPVISGVVLTEQATAPARPASSKRKLFVDPAGVLKLVDAAGVVTPVGGGAAPHHATHEPGGSDPLAVDAAAPTGSLRTLGTGATQAAPGNDSRFGSGGPPTGTAGGDLNGTYPNPQIAAGVITDLDVNAANKDGLAAVASLRTLGTGAQQATAGDDGRLTNARAPTVHATTHQPGGSDALAVDAAAGTGSLRTLGTGAAQAATGNHAHAGMIANPMTAAQDLIVGGVSGAPARLGVGASSQVLTVVGSVLAWATPASGGMTNPMTTTGDVIIGNPGGVPVRLPAGAEGQVLAVGPILPMWVNPVSVAPLAHATTHQPGGADAMAVDAAAGTGSLRTLGTSATAAAAGNDSRLSDSRAPSGTASGHLTGTYPAPSIAALVVTDNHVATANKDGAVGTASMRTIGAGATQAAAGNHTHGAAAPAAHATTHQPGGSDPMAVDAAAGTGSLRTLGTSATSAAAGNDARLTDSRAPSGTASGDLSGTYPSPQIAAGVIVDADVNAANKDGAAATPSLRTLGAGAAQAAAGNHAHAAYVTNPMTSSQDLIVGGASGAPTRLGVGAATQVLTVVGGVLTWATPASGGMTNPMTTLGDVIAGGASGAAQRLGVGTTDQVLSVVAGAPAWAAPIATDNLLTNPGLEVWSRGAGAYTTNGLMTADRWVLSLAGASTASVSRDATNQDTGSRYCAACTYTHAAAGSRLNQLIEDYAQLRGRTVTFAVRVRTSTASAVRISVWDSVNLFRYSSYHTGGGAYETLSVTAPIAAAATGVQCGVNLDATATVYVDNATLVTGSAALAYAPLHPALDLAACQRYYQEIGGLDANEYVATGQCTTATTAIVVVRYVVEMALAPTITVSAAGDFQVSNAAGGATAVTALAASITTARDTRLIATVAAGLVAGDATLLRGANTSARIRVEANPP